MTTIPKALTVDQFFTRYMAEMKVAAVAADTNSDGSLSQVEIDAFARSGHTLACYADNFGVGTSIADTLEAEREFTPSILIRSTNAAGVLTDSSIRRHSHLVAEFRRMTGRSVLPSFEASWAANARDAFAGGEGESVRRIGRASLPASVRSNLPAVVDGIYTVRVDGINAYIVATTFNGESEHTLYGPTGANLGRFAAE